MRCESGARREEGRQRVCVCLCVSECTCKEEEEGVPTTI